MEEQFDLFGDWFEARAITNRCRGQPNSCFAEEDVEYSIQEEPINLFARMYWKEGASVGGQQR